MKEAEHVAEAKGQIVHCERATFVAIGIPLGTKARISLGMDLGIGLTIGAFMAAGGIAIVVKLVGLVFP